MASVLLGNDDIRRRLIPGALHRHLVAMKTPAEDTCVQIAAEDALYGAILNSFQMNDAYHQSHATGRVFLVVYSFMLLILVSSYTGAVANLLARNHIELAMPDVPFSRQDAFRYLGSGVRASPDSTLAIVKGTSMENLLTNELGIDTSCEADPRVEGYSPGCKGLFDLGALMVDSGFDERDLLSSIPSTAAGLVMFEHDLMHLLARHEYLAAQVSIPKSPLKRPFRSSKETC